jgi:hypothetical protein
MGGTGLAEAVGLRLVGPDLELVVVVPGPGYAVVKQTAGCLTPKCSAAARAAVNDAILNSRRRLAPATRNFSKS